MLRDALIRVGREFPTARKEALTGHPLAQFIRVDLPANVRVAQAPHRAPPRMRVQGQDGGPVEAVGVRGGGLGPPGPSGLK